MKIELPGELREKLENYMRETSFTSVDELVLFILQDFIEQTKSGGDDGYSDDESEQIKKRLEDLGYL